MKSIELIRLWKQVKQVNHYRQVMRQLSDNQLKDKTKYFREKFQMETKLMICYQRLLQLLGS